MFYSAYKRDLAAAVSRVRESGSRVAETPVGRIEYLDWGQGQPVLWVHGVVGGCDQGPQMAQVYMGEGFRTIAMSRFGYLRSPLPRDASPAAQADLYAALLDTLGIEKVALVGTSAGSASSLLSTLMYSLLPVSLRTKGIMNDICVSNPAMNNIDIEAVTSPALIIHAVDDPMPPFAGAKQLASRLPHGRFMEVDRGGHLLVGHFEEVRAEISSFVTS